LLAVFICFFNLMMSELSESLKNHFLKQRNSRKPQKSFSRVSELSGSLKNHF